jgi:hypothetical protein
MAKVTPNVKAASKATVAALRAIVLSFATSRPEM